MARAIALTLLVYSGWLSWVCGKNVLLDTEAVMAQRLEALKLLDYQVALSP